MLWLPKELEWKIGEGQVLIKMAPSPDIKSDISRNLFASPWGLTDKNGAWQCEMSCVRLRVQAMPIELMLSLSVVN